MRARMRADWCEYLFYGGACARLARRQWQRTNCAPGNTFLQAHTETVPSALSRVPFQRSTFFVSLLSRRFSRSTQTFTLLRRPSSLTVADNEARLKCSEKPSNLDFLLISHLSVVFNDSNCFLIALPLLLLDSMKPSVAFWLKWC